MNLVKMNVLLSLLMCLPLLALTLVIPTLGRSRRGVIFGLTLPLDVAASAPVRQALARYRFRTTLVGCSLIALLLLSILLKHPTVTDIALAAAAPLQIAYALILRSAESRKLKPLVTKVPQERTAELLTSTSPVPLLAAIAAAIPVLITAFWLHLHWSSIPDRWPQHWNTAGQVNGWGTRTAGGVYGPLGMAVPILLVLVGLMAFQGLAPGPDVQKRQRFLVPLAALTWLMSLLFCGIALLPLAHLGESGILLVMAVHLPLTLAVIVWAVWRSGLAPAHTALADTAPYDGTPDIHWHGGGLFYSNRNDPAMLVPKRFGMGWTLNFGHRLAWLFPAGLLLLVIASIAFGMGLH